MPLTILSVAYPLAPVSEDAVGGAEQVLSALDRALVLAGHRSIVVAAAGSSVAGELVPVPLPAGVLDDAAKQTAQEATASAIRRTLLRRSVDVVHLHGVDFCSYLPPAGVPVLATLHLPPECYQTEALCPARPDTWVHCVSWNQHRRCPPAPSLLPPIGNGVDLDVFRPRYRKAGFALLLGRICPEKGIHHALEAASAAEVPLYIGGRVYEYEEHRRYYEREIVPRLRKPQRLLGPLGLQRKRRLLRAACCVLIPSQVQETSSLVAMEALASGTPVVAYPAGALAEIVRHGETGFLVSDTRAMASAIRNAGQIAPAACRHFAECCCDARRTIDAYLRIYGRLSGRNIVPDHADDCHTVRA